MARSNDHQRSSNDITDCGVNSSRQNVNSSGTTVDSNNVYNNKTDPTDCKNVTLNFLDPATVSYSVASDNLISHHNSHELRKSIPSNYNIDPGTSNMILNNGIHDNFGFSSNGSNNNNNDYKEKIKNYGTYPNSLKNNENNVAIYNGNIVNANNNNKIGRAHV